MTPRPGLLAFAWVSVAAAPLTAQVPRDVPLRESLTAKDVLRLGERVRALQAPADPTLLDAIDKLIKANPGLTPEQLAMKLLASRPELLDPKNAGQLLKTLDALKVPPPAAPPAAAPAVTPPKVEQNPPVTPTVNPAPPLTPPPMIEPTPPMIDPTTPGPSTGPPVGPPVVPPQTPMPVPTPPGGGNTPQAVDPPGPTPTETPVTPALPPATTEQEAQFRAATGWWEKNVGPINDSPAVKELLAEFIKGAGSSDGESPLASLLKGMKGEGGSGVKDFVKGVLPDGFKLPDLGLGGPQSLPTLPKAPAAPTGRPNLDFGGLGDSWAPVAAGLAVGLAAFGYFAALPWWRGRAAGLTPTPVPGLGPWPLDPRSVTDRDALVRAFDYLSVLTLGGAARQYNHVTVAGELRRLVPAAEDVADELGRYYEVARYTPPGEPIGAAHIAAARAALCRLAGVPA